MHQRFNHSISYLMDSLYWNFTKTRITLFVLKDLLTNGIKLPRTSYETKLLRMKFYFPVDSDMNNSSPKDITRSWQIFLRQPQDRSCEMFDLIG